MKSAKPPVVADAASSSRRSQPLRQTRTNPPRSSAGVARAGLRGDTLSSGPVEDQPIDIFPAITHFADAITALPKELVRHFTLLKEVDAKIFAPEEQLFRLVEAAVNAPLPEPRPINDAASSVASASGVPNTGDGSAAGQMHSSVHSVASTEDHTVMSTVFDPSNLPRRQLFRQTAFKIQEMLVALEEKNHVITTANEALQRQLARVEDVWPHLENEFSDEAKWGSTTHWAYPENRIGKTSHAERTRRDGAAAISAAAQALADEAAARSDARKQAVQAKRNMKNNHLESDFDDHHPRQKGEGKKSASKVRKAADSNNVGLGISASSASATGGNATKRRKVEKEINGGPPPERAMATALGGGTKAKTSSPRGTPAPDGQKKRKALPSASGQVKKSRNGLPGKSPSVTSSPVLGTLAEPKTSARASPAPGAAPRPASARARQNSLQSVSDSVKLRPSSSASNKPNGKNSGGSSEVATPAQTTSNPKPTNDVKPSAESSAPEKPEPPKKEPERREHSAAPAIVAEKTETKVEETDRKSESVPPPPLTVTTVTTKSGRASKPSTPAMATFQEAARSRPSRASDNGSNPKKHQKRASTASQALAAPIMEEERVSSGQGEDDDDADIDANEPRYCYCNGVSYGEMVACDSDDCEREWFHLACVGLKVAPGSKTKWYCEDCKERLKAGGKKINGR